MIATTKPRLRRAPAPAVRRQAEAAVHRALVASASPARQACACGGGCSRCRGGTAAAGGRPMLRVSAPADRWEREADRAGERVMQMPEPALARRTGGGRNDSRTASAGLEGYQAPPAVAVALRSPGMSLDPATRDFMESRFDHDFSGVRVHTGGPAARSARALDARAYAVGRSLVFDAGEYAPDSHAGRSLLAHELAHVVQHDRGEIGGPRLFRFVRRERDQIGDLDEVVDTAREVADDHGLAGLMRWGRFTAAIGGVGALEALTSPQSGSTATTPFPRYLYTCRCGLLDMRHFYQLMYIAVLRDEEAATEKGVEHEKTAEAASAFAPEDITSNALGAEFGSQRSWVQRQSTFVSALRSFLSQCEPVDWHDSAVTAAERDCVVEHYAVDAGGDTRRRQTAGADADPCNICSGQTSFPFTTDKAGVRIVGSSE